MFINHINKHRYANQINRHQKTDQQILASFMLLFFGFFMAQFVKTITIYHELSQNVQELLQITILTIT